MRIFVGEYVCGGGLSGTDLSCIPTSLRREGAAMLQAISTDLSKFSETTVPVDPRFDLMIDATNVVEVSGDQPMFAQWVSAAKDCDSAIIVAPENDGVLAKLVAMLRAGGIDVIAGSGDFLRVASDKLLTAKCLLSAGVSHPLYLTPSDDRYEAEVSGAERFIMKPRDGCGTQEIRTFDDFEEAKSELSDHSILQPWVSGETISISLVASGTTQLFLPAVGQQIEEGTCSYAGGQGPLDNDSQTRAMNLASRAIAAMPPTARGFIGLDLLLGECSSEDCVIEINPRLTTSYVGLRRMIRGNLAARLFDIETGPVSCNADVDSVRWSPDGEVWINDAVAEAT